MEKKRRALRSRQEWGQIVEDYVRSGLSAAAYCKRTGVSSTSLYKWSSRLKSGNGGARSGGFVPVRVVTEAKPVAREPSSCGPAAEVASVELVLLSGRKLVVKGGVEPERLAQLIVVAERC